MPSIFLDPSGSIAWGAIAGVGFALVFLAVGLYRTVEFSGLGLSKTVRVLLTVGHVLGTIVFSTSIAVLGMDTKREMQSLVGTLLFSGMVILFPIHIYVGLKRRILLKKAQDRANELKN